MLRTKWHLRHFQDTRYITPDWRVFVIVRKSLNRRIADSNARNTIKDHWRKSRRTLCVPKFSILLEGGQGNCIKEEGKKN